MKHLRASLAQVMSVLGPTPTSAAPLLHTSAGCPRSIPKYAAARWKTIGLVSLLLSPLALTSCLDITLVREQTGGKPIEVVLVTRTPSMTEAAGIPTPSPGLTAIMPEAALALTAAASSATVAIVPTLSPSLVHVEVRIEPEHPVADGESLVAVYAHIADLIGEPIESENVRFFVSGYAERDGVIYTEDELTPGALVGAVDSGCYVGEGVCSTLENDLTDSHGVASALFRAPSWQEFMKDKPIRLGACYRLCDRGSPSNDVTVFLRPSEPGSGGPLNQTRAVDGMEMVYVRAGTFAMGSPEGEGRHNEHPQHEVYLDAFWIDRTEVTNAQYRQCVQQGSCRAPTTCDIGQPTYESPSKSDEPVVCVSWEDARTYCQWAGVRLPTEAEWEKAARGTDGRSYPWGNSEPDCGKANFSVCGESTDRVGARPDGASPYGVQDLAGNVWEWVQDWYLIGYYGLSPGLNPQGPEQSQSRVLRGGSWFENKTYVRAARRYTYYPAARYNVIGFRCAGSPGE